MKQWISTYTDGTGASRRSAANLGEVFKRRTPTPQVLLKNNILKRNYTKLKEYLVVKQIFNRIIAKKAIWWIFDKKILTYTHRE